MWNRAQPDLANPNRDRVDTLFFPVLDELNRCAEDHDVYLEVLKGYDPADPEPNHRAGHAIDAFVSYQDDSGTWRSCGWDPDTRAGCLGRLSPEGLPDQSGLPPAVQGFLQCADQAPLVGGCGLRDFDRVCLIDRSIRWGGGKIARVFRGRVGRRAGRLRAGQLQPDPFRRRPLRLRSADMGPAGRIGEGRGCVSERPGLQHLPR